MDSTGHAECRRCNALSTLSTFLCPRCKVHATLLLFLLFTLSSCNDLRKDRKIHSKFQECYDGKRSSPTSDQICSGRIHCGPLHQKLKLSRRRNRPRPTIDHSLRKTERILLNYMRGGWGGGGWGSTNMWGASTNPPSPSPPILMNKKAYNPENDPEITSNPPSDGITDLQFSPNAPALGGKSYLVAASWDSTIRCWQVNQLNNPGGSQFSSGISSAQGSISTQSVGMQKISAPALSCAWKNDGSVIFFGGLDHTAYMWTISTGQVTPIAKHNAPITKIFWSEVPSPCVITGSLDGTIKFWAVPPNPSGTPLHTIQTPGRVYAMDVKQNLMIVGTDRNRLVTYNLKNLQIFKEKECSLKYQLRCISIFPDLQGCCIGSIEGKVSVEYIQDEKKCFSFKCHRVNAQGSGMQNNGQVYAVNDISFHPVIGTLATVGGDGAYYFWDRVSKSRLKSTTRSALPLVKCCFNHDGSLFSYAACYDWHQGHAAVQKFISGGVKCAIMIRSTRNDPQPKAPTPDPTIRTFSW